MINYWMLVRGFAFPSLFMTGASRMKPTTIRVSGKGGRKYLYMQVKVRLRDTGSHRGIKSGRRKAGGSLCEGNLRCRSDHET